MTARIPRWDRIAEGCFISAFIIFCVYLVATASSRIAPEERARRDFETQQRLRADSAAYETEMARLNRIYRTP